MLIIVMIVLNIYIFGGAGYVVSLVPFYWLVRSVYQYRVLSRSLAAAPPE